MTTGTSIPRVDGPAKLSGQARYVDDIVLPGMIHGATVRTQTARGKILDVVFDPAIDWDEFAVVTHEDILGVNGVKFLEDDGPALVAGEFRHAQEPVVLLAHPDPEKLREAVDAVKLITEPLPAVFDPMEKLSPAKIQHGTDNVFKRITINKGDTRPVFSSAPHVIENVYRTGAQEHAYLETNGVIAYIDEEKRLTVMGSMQCPYYVVKAMEHLFELPEDRIRVIQTTTGGAFGGKEDYPSIIAIHAALLARKAGCPVKLVYDRAEDMAATTKRHPSVIRHRTAFDDDGKLLAMEIDAVLDSGAYMTLSPVVLSRGVIHAAGPYRCGNIRIFGEARLTNKPPNGAFRGFGAPQTLFAVERQMDAIADYLKKDPTEIRRRNLIQKGDQTATQQVIDEDIDLAGWMDQALEMAHYEEKKAEHKKFNAEHPYLRRGIGFSTFHHGAGFTGSGEVFLASKVWVKGHADGRAEILISSTEMGQGAATVMAQIGAGALGVDVSKVYYAQPDTARVPDSGPTVASRTVMIVGALVEKACEDLLAQLGVARGPGANEAIAAWHKDHPSEKLVGRAQYEKPKGIVWDDENYVGAAYGTYAWACYAAEVEIDLRTFETRVIDFVASQEIGKIINPVLAEGQIQGGVAQAIGWALMENVVEKEGAMANNQMTNYIIPVSGDLPLLRVKFLENGGVFGPGGGAKGIGELPMDGPAPAVINAVCHALGTQKINRIPLTPENLMEDLEV